MRMADIIRLNDKNFLHKKKFPYPADEAQKKNSTLEMKRIEAVRDNFTDEHKDVEEIYSKNISELRFIFDRTTIDFYITPNKNILQNLATELVDKLSLCSIDIIKLFMRHEQETNYLYSHSVNVTFLSVMLGVWLNYNKSDLNKLAIASMLHDIGMVKVLKLALLPRKLTSTEQQEIGKHPTYSRDFASMVPDMDIKVIEAIYNHHKRVSRATNSICEYAQIIGLADIFEALTHPRTYRKALEPHNAVIKIIEEIKVGFDSKIIKALIDNVGIYPAGTWVILDTDEIGLVIDINSGMPLSPKVNILFDRNKTKLPEPRTVDLSRLTNLHVKKPLETDAQYKLQELLLVR